VTTFNAIELICPLCKQSMGHYELMSYHIHSSTVFSDGKVEHNASFLEDKSMLVCPHCHEVFWRDDALEKEIHYEEDQKELPFSMSVLDLEPARRGDYPEGLIAFYNQLLSSGFANNDHRELYLRMLLWRTINDLIRYQKPLWKTIDRDVLQRPLFFIKNRWQSNRTFHQNADLHHENLTRLVTLFQPIEQNDMLLKAEMYREMGNRKQALNVLNSLNSNQGSHIRKIRRATLWFKKQVFQLSK